MKIGRNDLCPCRSNKKYKKCCIDKVNSFAVDNKQHCDFKGEQQFSSIGVLRKKKGKHFNKEINDLLLIGERLYYDRNELAAQDYYFKVMDYLIAFAKENNIKTLNKLDECGIIEEFIGNVTQDFEIVINNSNYKIEELLGYLDRLKNTFELDDETLKELIRTKFRILFKLNKYDEAESMMLDYIKKKPKSIWSYVDLVDEFRDIKDYKKAKHYYDMGIDVSDINNDDREYLEERLDDWYEEVS